jgi:hypothetical protein
MWTETIIIFMERLNFIMMIFILLL